MHTIVIAAHVDFEALERLVKKLPQLLENPPRLELRCQGFVCDSVEDLMNLLKCTALAHKSGLIEGQAG